jgi:phosphorylcholine metabolism protein LicD
MEFNKLQIYKTYFSDDRGFGKNKTLAIELLEKTIKMLDEFNIDYMLISGTLLGYIRHNGFIPWDDDIDLLVSPKILDKLPEILKKYNNDSLTFLKIDDYLLKVCLKNNTNIITRKSINEKLINKKDVYTFPFIDLFIFNYRHDNKCIAFFKKTWDINYFFPLKKIDFLNIKNVSIPNNPYYFLAHNYGPNYMSKLISSNWDHKTENELPNVEELTMDEYNSIKILN